MRAKNKAVYDAVKNNPGSSTNKIAECADAETSDSYGGHQNWDVYEILKELEREGLIEDRRPIKRRGSPCQWYVVDRLI